MRRPRRCRRPSGQYPEWLKWKCHLDCPGENKSIALRRMPGPRKTRQTASWLVFSWSNSWRIGRIVHRMQRTGGNLAEPDKVERVAENREAGRLRVSSG